MFDLSTLLMVVAETPPPSVFPVFDELAARYGLAVAEAVVVALGFASGKFRFEREVKREKEDKETQLAEKNARITELASDLRANTTVMNRIADGIEERNKIERQMRGRRS